MTDQAKKVGVNQKMMLSDAGKASIAKDEGFSAYPYDDQAKHCTVGTGILISMAPCTPEQKTMKYDPNKLSSSFNARILEAQHYVRHDVTKTVLTQSQFDALTSFVFNVGVGNAKQVLSYQFDNVANEMARFVNVKVKDSKGKIHLQKSNGLITRRTRETAAFKEQK